MRPARLAACVVEEEPGLADAIRGGAELDVRRVIPPLAPLDLAGIQVLFHEDREGGSAAVARARSLASADPDVLLVCVVPEGTDAEQEHALREAGACDVVRRGDGLEHGLRRCAAVARRLTELQAERAKLSAGLAHDDRMSAIGLLTAGVGHEINNPNNAILANLESLRADVEALLARPRQQQIDQLPIQAAQWFETLGDSIAASRRIAAIVRSLSVFRRSGPDSPRLESVVLNDEVTNAMRLIGREVRYQAKVDLELDPELPAIMAPAHALTQVVTNLVMNAVQALEAVEPERRRLRVHTSADDEVVCLEVQDTGPGMTAEVLDHAFDPFFSTKPGGTGLGLAVARELVRKAGGEILVESSEGAGTTFRVVLPRPPPVAERPRRLSAPPPPVARLRVLIVDDDELLLRALLRALRQEFECTGASSGRSALERVQRGESFDVVVTDIVMPEMNGLELYRAIEQLDPALAERALFLSGGLQASALAQGIRDTGRGLLDKPLSARELARRIHELAAERRSVPPPPR